MISFLSPLFLAGALAAGVPILLHLLKREPEARVKFSAVRLLRKKLELAEENHQSAKARTKIDKNGALVELQARAGVLEAQIQLLREEEKAKASE